MKNDHVTVSNNSQNICSLFTSEIYQPKIKCKDGGSYFYKNQKYRSLEIEKKIFFSYFVSEIPNLSYMCFFRKCSMFRRSIPLKKVWSHTFKASLEEIIVMLSEKMKAKNTWRGMCERVFFVKLQAGTSQLHYELASSQIIFRDFDWINTFK